MEIVHRQESICMLRLGHLWILVSLQKSAVNPPGISKVD